MAASTEEEQQPVFVLSTPVVRWGVSELRKRRVHSFFLAYIEARRQGVLHNSAVVQPDWSRFDSYLRVGGGPPNKPWFRPFWDQARNANQDWMKAHPAGSYNPKSIRPGTPGARVLKVEDNTFVFDDGHWERALEHLLHGKQMPLIPLCVFLYRNYGFYADGPGLFPGDLVGIFRDDFLYRPEQHEHEFDVLYDVGIAERTDWFEPAGYGAAA